jgi:hypothetical protein
VNDGKVWTWVAGAVVVAFTLTMALFLYTTMTQ